MQQCFINLDQTRWSLWTAWKVKIELKLEGSRWPAWLIPSNRVRHSSNETNFSTSWSSSTTARRGSVVIRSLSFFTSHLDKNCMVNGPLWSSNKGANVVHGSCEANTRFLLHCNVYYSGYFLIFLYVRTVGRNVREENTFFDLTAHFLKHFVTKRSFKVKNMTYGCRQVLHFSWLPFLCDGPRM